MITKEQKQLIQDVKRESGTNEFLSVSDLIVRIEENYKKKGEDIYYEDVGITFSEWNNFLRNTPLSVDLFIGEGAIFEGFKKRKRQENAAIYHIEKQNSQLVFGLDKSTWGDRFYFSICNTKDREVYYEMKNLHELLAFLANTKQPSNYFFLK